MTKEQTEVLEKWVKREFWPHYPCRDGLTAEKGKVSRLIKYVIRDNPSEDLRLEIVRALKAQVKASQAQSKRGAWVRWGHASTWWNDRSWNDPVETIAEKPPIQLGQCSIDGCTEFTHGPSFNKCSYHTSMQGNLVDKLRETYRKSQAAKSG